MYLIIRLKKDKLKMIKNVIYLPIRNLPSGDIESFHVVSFITLCMLTNHCNCFIKILFTQPIKREKL